MLISRQYSNSLPSNGTVDCAGYLYKTSLRPKFRKRFYILKNNMLYYYINQQHDGIPKGWIKLTEDPEKIYLDEKKKNNFHLETFEGKEYSVVCPTPEEAKIWTTSIKNSILSHPKQNSNDENVQNS
eukprot:TRINITY_DN6305_c0_g1_i2.p1 TRINITY_DN6305_c0_g1~~TRINITY_DN6305_c0_g1_i2.p1  ORF type:complete len:127 (-),score=35.78 TRINITY_DN6305_c0_g1_i2:11-391(-)